MKKSFMKAVNSWIYSETGKANNRNANSRRVKRHASRVTSYPPFLKVKNQTGTEDIHYSVVHGSLPPEFEAVAATELKETPSSRKGGLCQLREYMTSNNIPMLEEHLLLAVLRSCNFDIKKSEMKLRKFSNTRTNIIKQLLTLDMDTVENIIDDMAFGMLPYRDKHGSLIFYTRPYAGMLDMYSVDDMATVYLVATLFALTFPLTTTSGIVYFADCACDDMYMFNDMLKILGKHVFPFLCLPIRLTRVEVLNENVLCQSFFKFVNTMISKELSKELTDRVCLHGTEYDKLFQKYSRDILPEEFGGKTGPISNEIYREKLLDFIEDLKNKNS